MIECNKRVKSVISFTSVSETSKMVSLHVERGRDDEAKEKRTTGWIHQSLDGRPETARQLDGLELDRTFTDKLSGKDTSAPVAGCP